MILGDGMIGQMMEPVEMPEYKPRHAARKGLGRHRLGRQAAASAPSSIPCISMPDALRRAVNLAAESAI